MGCVQPDSASLLKLLEEIPFQPSAKKPEIPSSLPHPSDVTSLKGSYFIKPVTFCFQTIVQNGIIFINPEQFAKYKIRIHSCHEFRPPFPPVNPGTKFTLSRIQLSGYEDNFGSFVVKASEFTAQNIRILGNHPESLLTKTRQEPSLTVSIFLVFSTLFCIYSNTFCLCRLN